MMFRILPKSFPLSKIRQWSGVADRLRSACTSCARRGVELLLPPHCVNCSAEMESGDDNILLCGQCRQTLGAHDRPRCRRCGASLDCPAPQCPWCCKHQLQFDEVLALGEYVDPLRAMLLRLKRPRGDALSTALGGLLAQRHRDPLAELQPQFVVPIPMHWQRRIWRGTNNTDILAQTLATAIPSARACSLLVRTRNTLPQKELQLKDRFRNMRGAFWVRAGYHLHGMRILLVDDILTTGATCNAAAEALKRAGATRVAVAILARAEGRDSR
jgi:ComF family protein